MDRTKLLLDRLTAWSPVLLLGGLAALTYWLDAQVQAPVLRADGNARHDPDLYIENIRAVALDVDGRPRQLLKAERADHFPDDDTTQLLKPSLMLTEPGKPAFHVKANQGKVSGDRQNAWFTGGVQAVREAQPASGKDRDATGAVTLATEYLHVLPQQHKVVTDKPVTVEEPRGIIQSVGIELDTDAKTIKLKSSVRGTLQPQMLNK